MVEDAIDRAIASLLNRDHALAQEVLDGDRIIDEFEVAVEEDCLKILALHQPVAADLRFIVGAIKVNNDLERMGDTAVNIAERAAFLATHPPLSSGLDFSRMTLQVQTMVRDSLDALVNLDTTLARKVMLEDDAVDDMNRRMFEVLQVVMASDSEKVERAVHQLSVSRHLERIADLATNIAEDVVFMVDGEIVRHRFEDFNKPTTRVV
jgi:phosphate transport system protein